MADKNNSNNTDSFRFNNSKLHGVNALPTTIDWSALQKNLKKNVNSENKSMWGFIQDQDKLTKNNRKKD